MKCLAIGMNPNYVLSEEERKKRFKKKNNSGEFQAEIERQPGRQLLSNSVCLHLNLKSGERSCGIAIT